MQRLKDNVVIIICDSLRHDFASNPSVMPVLVEFGKKHVWLAQAYTNAPSTHFALPTLLTGYMPLEKTNRARIEVSVQDRYLPNLFGKKGYRTLGITGNVVTSSFFGYDEGFDYYEDYLKGSRENELRYAWLLELASLIPAVLKDTVFLSLKRMAQRFVQAQNFDIQSKVRASKILETLKSFELTPHGNFIFLHFMEPHIPYAPLHRKKDFPRILALTKKMYEQSGELDGESVVFLKQMYAEECKVLDKVLGEVFEYLRKKLDWESTRVLVLGDHGEAFGETGYFVHPGDRTSNTEYHIRIPVAIKGIPVGEKEIHWLRDLYSYISGVRLDGDYHFCVGYKRVADKGNPRETKYAVTEVNFLDRIERGISHREMYSSGT